MIDVAGLNRSRAGRAVVQALSLRVESGEIVGLIGVNGAGKTSAIECLAGLAAPDAGAINIGGNIPATPAARAITGVVLQTPGLPGRLRVAETLALFAGLYAARPNPELAERLGLLAIGQNRVDRLSGGQRQRLALALALQHRPSVILLDEPATSLDAAMRRDLAVLLAQQRDAGAAILMATHDLAEAASLCDRVVLMSQGRVVAQGRPADLVAAAGGPSRIRLVTARPLPGEASDTIVVATHDVVPALHSLLARVGPENVVELTVAGAGLADLVLAMEKAGDA